MLANKLPLKKIFFLFPPVFGAIVYLTTVCPGVKIGDSGEFGLVFRIAGIAHPPGYPLFSLIGRVFLLLTGFLRPIFSANLLNVLIAAFSLLIVFLLTGDKKYPLLSAIFTLIWAFTPIFWRETVGVEVYALNLLFVILISYLAMSDIACKWLILAYLLGLSCAHHPTVLCLILPLLYIFIVEAKIHHFRYPIPMVILFLLGLSIYLYLPLRSALQPLANWGDPSTASNFFRHITAVQYQYALEYSFSRLGDSLNLFLSLIVSNWWWIGFLIILTAGFFGLMQDLKGTLFWLILMMSNVVLVSFYTIPDIEPYYLPAMFAGFVLSVKMGYWLLKRGATMNLAHIITLPVALVLMASLLIVNYHKIDHSDYTLSQDYGRLILNSAGEGTVFTGDDLSSFPVLYLRYAEGYAPQVEAYDKASRLKALMDKAQSLLSLPVSDYYSARRVYIEKSPGVKHIVKSHHIYDQQWLDSPVRLYSNGLLFSTQPPLKKISWEQIHPPSYVEDFKVRQLLVNIELCKGKELLLSQPRDSISAVHYFLNAFEILKDEPRAALHNQLGIYFRRWGYADLALKSYDRALKSPRLSKSEREDIIFNISNVHKDIGNSCVSRGDFSGAVEAYEKALEYDPQNPKILYNLGLIYCQYLQSPGKALPYLEAYIKLKPEDQQVLNLLHAIRSQISPTVINK